MYGSTAAGARPSGSRRARSRQMEGRRIERQDVPDGRPRGRGEPPRRHDRVAAQELPFRRSGDSGLIPPGPPVALVGDRGIRLGHQRLPGRQRRYQGEPGPSRRLQDRDIPDGLLLRRWRAPHGHARPVRGPDPAGADDDGRASAGVRVGELRHPVDTGGVAQRRVPGEARPGGVLRTGELRRLHRQGAAQVGHPVAAERPDLAGLQPVAWQRLPVQRRDP